MKKTIIYVSILILSSILLTGCTKKADYDTSKVKVVGSDEQTEQKDEPNEEETETKDTKDLGYLSDPSTFTKDTQTVGSSTDGKFKLVGITDNTNSGYHRISFEIQKLEDSSTWPIVTAENSASNGVVRVTVSSMFENTADIPFQASRVIDKGAIGGIYHAVTSKENTGIYEVGVSGENPFKLTSEEVDGSWIVNLDIAYDLKYAAPDMDLGSTEFSMDEQSIKGIEKDGGAKVTSYSYSVSGGVLKFVYTVASGTSNPIPSVNASFDDMNILNVTFPSLESDKVSTWGKSITLPAGIVVEVSRAGDSSTYKFGGIGANKEFKLSASKSPNQVIVEIRL